MKSLIKNSNWILYNKMLDITWKIMRSHYNKISYSVWQGWSIEDVKCNYASLYYRK